MTHPFQSGVIPAPIMPFKEDASIDWKTYDRYIGQIAAADVTAIAVNMAAAEATALEADEQIEAVKRAKKVSGSRPIISGVIAPYTAGAVKHAKRLVDAGADGLVAFPPLPTFLSKPLPVSVVVDFHAAIAEANDGPLIAFNTANCTYPAGTIKALAGIERIVAIKDAAFDIERTAEFVEEADETNDKIVVLTGNDTFVIEAMLLGCPGALIGLAGTFTAELVRMQKLAAQRKITEGYEIWDAIGPLARLIWSAPLRDYRARMKYVLLKQGVISSDTTRAPQTRITDKDRAKVDLLFSRHGLGDKKYLPQG